MAEINLFKNEKANNAAYGSIDKEILAALKKVPLQYRSQIIALIHYNQLKKANDQQIKSRVSNVIHKHKKERVPIFEESNKVISGERGLTEQELKYAEKYLTKQEKLEAHDCKADEIPGYWSKVFTNCERLRREVHELDQPALRSLKTIEHIPEEQEKYNFTLKFNFKNNEFFTDETLSVRFVMLNQGEEIVRIEASPIHWKEGKNYTKRAVQFKQQNKKTGETRVVTKVMQISSFFDLFKSMRPKGPSEEQDKTLKMMGLKHNLGLLIRDEILVYHLEYFLGKRSGGIDYPLYVDYMKEEKEAVEDEGESPAKSGKKEKKGKEEKKEDKTAKDTKKSEVKPQEAEPEKKGGCGVQ